MVDSLGAVPGLSRRAKPKSPEAAMPDPEPQRPLDRAASERLVHDPAGRHGPAGRDHAPPARPGRPAAPGTSSRTSPPSRPTRSKRPTRSPTRSSAGLGRVAGRAGRPAVPVGLSTPRWPRRRGFSTSTTWCGRSPTRWWRATRMSSATKAATSRPPSRPRDWERIKARRARRQGRARHARRRGARAAGADARGEAAEPRGAGRLRLALDRRGDRQDRRGGARAGRGARGR